MEANIANVTLTGITPLSMSRQHDEPFLSGENHADYDRRTWRKKLNTAVRNGRETVVIPAHGIMQAFTAAARYSKRKIPGARGGTWTAKFQSGIAILEDPALGIDPESVQSIVISANADGVRGSGKRVPRIFPMMPVWQTSFEVLILDPVITEEVFAEMVKISGLFIGLGRFRPEKGGTNGRFALTALAWEDNRKIAA